MPTDPQRQERIEDLFHELLEIPVDERESRLRDRCAGDAAMEQELRELLGCLRDAPEHLDSPAIPPPDLTDERVGPFRVVRLLGEGGMGQVFEAQQDFPSRRVAIKLIRTGLTNQAMLRRFEFEATALAQLHHPGIAQIYEAGFVDAGQVGILGKRPYFAMELIEGRRLDEFASDLPTNRILEITAMIADAVHHAHQRGIIHRDLKPGNLLVEESGGSPRPVVLDFGVARLAPELHGEMTQHTATGQMIGTIAYMSPEQIVDGDVDTRCDVYALGVIAYQLLSGRLPHDTSGSSLIEAARIITEQDPAPLATMRRDLRGDVSTIVAKAMHRNRDQRYTSAAEFAADIRRFLAHEPIQARPATAGYLIRRFVERHRVLAAAAAIVTLLVVGSSIGMGVLYSKEQAQRRIADIALATAQREVQRQKATLDLLVNDAFGAASPAEKGIDLRVLDVLDDAAVAVELRFPSDPPMRAYLRSRIGDLLGATGQYEKSDTLLRLALDETPPEDLETAALSRMSLGANLMNQGRPVEAMEQYERAIDLATRIGEHGYDAAANARLGMAEALQRLGRHAEAEPILRDLIATDKPRIELFDRPISVRLTLAASLRAQNRDLEEIGTLLREAYELAQSTGQVDRPAGLAAMNNYVAFLLSRGQNKEAIPIAVALMEAGTRIYPKGHPFRGFAELTAAHTLLAAGRATEARDAALRGVEDVLVAFDEAAWNVEKARAMAFKACDKAGDTVGAREQFAGWLGTRLLAAGVDEGEGVVKRMAEYRDLLIRYGATEAEADEGISRFVDDCRTAYGPDSERRTRLLANIARAVMALSPPQLDFAATLLSEARAALPHSERDAEDRALLDAVEDSLRAARN